MNLRAVLLVAACSLAFVPALSAGSDGDVRVTFADGRVTVIAENATIGEILQEWARVGGSRFVNAEKIPSTQRVTLRLEDEPETRAIEVLLRSVAGYVIAPRAAGSASASSVGNVLIMPVSRVASYAQAPPPVPMVNPADNMRMVGGPPRPDDDGPVRREAPPEFAEQRMQQLQQQLSSTTQGQAQQGNTPVGSGYASPLGGVQTQTGPGLGIVTSSQPGAVIQNPPRPGGRPPVITPTQPRRGGGGG